MWLISGRISTIGIRARLKIWSYACPGEATLQAPRGGRLSIGGATGVKMASTLSSARRRVIVFSGATWKGRQGVVVGKPVMDDRWWERWCRGAVPEVSWRSSSGRVGVKKSWACKFARRVSVESVSRRCFQVFVSVRIRCSWSASRSRSCPGARIDVREDKVAAWPSVCLGVEIKLGV
jgi:hypothetical protein